MTTTKTEAADHQPTTIRSLPVDEIDPSPYQARKFSRRPDERLRQLAASIRAVGVIEPVLVRAKSDGRWELIAGERRTRAARIAKLDSVPGLVLDVDEQEALHMTVVENLQREDLSPIEESEGVATLIDKGGREIEDVAAEIGRTPAWVAGRLAIGRGLSKTWAKKVRSPKAEQSKLGVGSLLLVSRLPHGAQDRLLSVEWLWHGNRDAPTETAIRRAIDSELLQRLARAPWKLDDAELVPEAGSCAACPKRSGHQPLLWQNDESGGGTEQGELCLDRACFQAKGDAHVASVVAAAKKRHGGDLVLLSSEYSGRPEGTAYAYSYHSTKAGARGAVPVVWVDGRRAGQHGWARRDAASSGSTVKKRKGPTPLKERKVRLRRLRLKLAIAGIARDLEALTVADAERLPSLGDLAVLAVVFGTSYKRESCGYYYPLETYRLTSSDHLENTGLSQALIDTARKESLKEAGSGPWELFRAYHDGDVVRDLAVRWALWLALLPVAVSRLFYQSSSPIEQQWTEACQLAAMVGVETEPHWQAAVAEKPEPKSWANLKADGTPRKKKAEKKKKATSKTKTG